MSSFSSKMYADHTKGWVTAQNLFNQDETSVSYAKNVLLDQEGTGFQKRQGYSTVLDSDFSPDEPVINTVAYESLSGQETFLHQVKEEWYKTDGDGTRTLVHSGADTTRHGHTMFNGRFIFGSENQAPKKFFFLQPPLPPTTGQTSSGSLNSRTYYVKITYVSANGETTASSPVVRQDVDANKVLTVTSPASQDGATDYKVYVGEDSDDLYFQEKLSVGTDYQEKNAGIDKNTSAPPSENTAWAVQDLGGSPPDANVWHTHNSRVFAAGTNDNRMKLHYSALENEDSWGTAGTAGGNGIIEFEKILDYGDEIIGMASLQDRLLVFFTRSVVSLIFPTDATQYQVEQVMRGKGCVSKHSIIGVGNDVFWLSRHGIESVGQNFGTEDVVFSEDNPSRAINDTIGKDVEQIEADNTQQFVDCVYYYPDNLLVWLIPQSGSSDDIVNTRLYVLDLDYGAAWTFLEGPNFRSMDVDRHGTWYGGLSGNLADFFDGSYDDDGADIECIVSTVWLYLGNPSIVKKGKFLKLPSLSEKPTNVEIRYVWDYAIQGYENENVNVDNPGADDWDESLWDTAPFNAPRRTMPRIPIRGRGTSLKLNFIEKSQTDFQIPWYRVDFKQGGMRNARG